MHDLADSFDAWADDFDYMYHSTIRGANRLSPVDVNADAAAKLPLFLALGVPKRSVPWCEAMIWRSSSKPS